MAITYPGTLDSFSTKQDAVDDVDAVDINDLQDAVEELEAKVGITSSAETASLDYKVNNFFTTDRSIYLYEHTTGVPTGWSYVSTVEDKVLAVRGTGSGDEYDANGGVATQGSWTMSDAHTLTAAESGVPAHTHNVLGASSYGPPAGGAVVGVTPSGNDVATSSNTTASAASSHSHWDDDYRPSAALGIIIIKD